MDDDLSHNRLIRNEQLLRNRNVELEQAIERFSQGDKDVRRAPVDFICECSVLSCKKHIRTTINHYKHHHKRRDHFIVLRGHIIPSLEKIVVHEDGFDVVEKLQLSA
jgi:hypothetical protein